MTPEGGRCFRAAPSSQPTTDPARVQNQPKASAGLHIARSRTQPLLGHSQGVQYRWTSTAFALDRRPLHARLHDQPADLPVSNIAGPVQPFNIHHGQVCVDADGHRGRRLIAALGV